MTPRTRNSNRDADFKVYYSKDVPQQVYFPHKRKTVRRRTTPVRDGQEKRQMVFLPDKMREQKVVDDSEDSRSLDTDMEESVGEGTTRASKWKGRKRNSDIMKEEPDSEHDDSIAIPSKRRRKIIPSKSHRRPQRIQAISDNKADQVKSADRERTLRRQSTMTQLVDGRKPLPDVEEPDFKPVKKPPRLSWSGKGKKSRDEKQRTLTQMVPGMRPLDIMSDEDLDEAPSDAEIEDKHDQAYGDAVARRLAQQGLYQTGDNDRHGSALMKAEQKSKSKSIKKEEESAMTDSQGVNGFVVQSVEDDCDSYKPTQSIEAPLIRLDRVTRRNTKGRIRESGEAPDTLPKSTRSSKSRFSLLSTPQKRRIREIPSSQSPAESPVATQVTPHNSDRSSLKQCMANSNNAVAEAPSKRKQVAFSMPSKTPVPPPKLRRFENTIQDSEDEEDDIIEEDAFLVRRVEKDVDESVEVATPGNNSIGTDTQRMLGEIDRACDEANTTGDTVGSESSTELGDSSITRGYQQPYPERGESHEQSPSQKEQTFQKEQLARCNGPTKAKQEPESEDEDDKDYPERSSVPIRSLRNGSPLRDDAAISIKTELPAHTDELHSSPPALEVNFQETFASTPMVLQDDSSDEERSLDRDPTPPRSSRRPLPQPTSAGIQQSTDLDGESIQVPRSPSPQHESQKSDSSKAEQQLQNEWLSYSQYVKARPVGSSSVRVAPDAFSYDVTPRPPRNPAPPLQHHSSGYRPSQATTVDEITQRTPRTKRTQHMSSTHTTPHRIASSQPVFTTPNKLPPPLFIPSSFPSPDKAGAHAEGWSSPVISTTQDATRGHDRNSQWASLEDFSIPPPPPPPPACEEGEDEEE